MRTLSPRFHERSQALSATEPSGSAPRAEPAGPRLVHSVALPEAGPRPARPRLRRLLGLQMDAFVAEAMAGEHPRVLAGRIDNIIQLSLALSNASRSASSLRRRGGSLAGILRNLEAQRTALLARELAPSGIRHALDPLLMAVLRGDLEPD